MRCDNCREREAAVHLTQVVDNSVTTLHLCPQCAAEKGVQTETSVAKFPLSDFLASLGQGVGTEIGPGDAQQSCDFCNSTLQEFRKTGRLGCPHCYDSFEGHHTGEVYLTPELGESEAKEYRLTDLRQKLKGAVAAENFELAAEIRDRIRAME